MSIATSELQVSEGLANDYDLGALNYGVLLHRRRNVGDRVREDFEYRPLVDTNTNPLRLPGIGPDDDRIDFERGHGTFLDRCLVRRSAFRFAPTAATGQGVGSLQQLFLVIKPKKGSTFQPALGLKWLGGPDLAPRVCPPDGLPPVRIWSTAEWQDSTFVEAEPYTGDITEWAEALGHRAAAAVTTKASPAPPKPFDRTSPNKQTRDQLPSPRGESKGRLHVSGAEPQISGASDRDSRKWTRKQTLTLAALVVVAVTIGIGQLANWQSGAKRAKEQAARDSIVVKSPSPPSRSASTLLEPTAEARKLACKDDPFPLHCERKLSGK